MPDRLPITLSITRPDDWHVHLRQEPFLSWVLPHTSRVFARALAMPNVTPPLTSLAACKNYHKILRAKADKNFLPLVAFYLTDNTSAKDIQALCRHQEEESDFIVGAKLYPRGATTNSEHGVSDARRIMPALSAMQKHRLPLLVHGEDPSPEVDIYDREQVYIDKVLEPLRRELPELKITLEHITTKNAVAWVRSNPLTAATITPHHLLFNRNSLFAGGLRPHNYCLPLAKREEHRLSLVAAACGGAACFFAGTDSAPHYNKEKESDCGCAGIFCAPTALETYAEIFARAGKLDKLEAFTSFNGADFYGRKRNRGLITLKNVPWRVPKFFQCEENVCVPFRAGETIAWQARAS